MATVDKKLFDRNLVIEVQLQNVANHYKAMRDARWMFARAHQNITHQINVALATKPDAFRNPDQMLRFNISFATAFLAAAAGTPSAPWKRAFLECAIAEVYMDDFALPQVGPYPMHWRNPFDLDPDPTAVKACAVAMANAHINTDIVSSLKTIGCIDKNDYGNILLFVERGSRDAIIELHGRITGPIFDALKEWFLPLDKLWRNSVYEEVCRMPVPDVEQAFQKRIDEDVKRMLKIQPSAH